MQINTQSQKQASQESGVDESTLSKVRQGKEGFSAAAAKSMAQVAGKDAVSLYLSTQVNSITKRRDAGEIDNPTVLKAVGRVLSTLKSEFPNAQIEDGPARALQNLATEASKKAVPVNNFEALGRDTSGLPLKKHRTTEIAAMKEKNVPGIYGALGRNVDGTSRKGQLM